MTWEAGLRCRLCLLLACSTLGKFLEPQRPVGLISKKRRLYQKGAKVLKSLFALNFFSCWKCHLSESWTAPQLSICSLRIVRFILLLNILMWWVILLLVKYFLNQQLELALVNGAPMSMALKPQHKESDFAFFC